MPRQDAFEHAGVGLAQHEVGLAAGGAFDAVADGPAVDEHGLLVGRADLVGVGGEVGAALRGPVGGHAEVAVLERGVEGDDEGIGRVVGGVVDDLESRLGELGAQALGSKDVEPPEVGAVGAQVFDHAQPGGEELVGADAQVQRVELGEVVAGALRGVVGQEGVADAEPVHALEKGLGPGEERAARIDGAIHVERQVANVRKLLFAHAQTPSALKELSTQLSHQPASATRSSTV